MCDIVRLLNVMCNVRRGVKCGDAMWNDGDVNVVVEYRVMLV